MYDEKTLIKQSQSGDMDAFEKLILQYERKIYTIAYKYMGNHEDASDLAQEAFIKAYQSIGSFRAEASFGTWLGRITANKCLDELRRRKRRPTASLDEELELEDSHVARQLRDPKPLPEDEVARKETAAYVQKLIDDLKPDYKTVIILRELEGLSYEEIAALTDSSLGTVKSRISRARQQLQQQITQWERRNSHDGL